MAPAVLLLKRSDEGDAAGTWALPGGKVEEGETDRDAALRELQEECRIVLDNSENLKLLHVKIGNPLCYTTYSANVREPFTPQLNDEHTGHVWARMNDLPEPLHPGVQEMFQDMGELPR